MIVTALLVATVATAEPAPAAQPAVAPSPVAEKKMACCDKMAKGEGCDCCKDMDGKSHAEHDTKDNKDSSKEHAH